MQNGTISKMNSSTMQMPENLWWSWQSRTKKWCCFQDPPRSGSDEAFLSSVVKLAPKKVVYVSCNPETLARDLKYLTRHGYQAVECQPCDMFSRFNETMWMAILSLYKEILICVDMRAFFETMIERKRKY